MNNNWLKQSIETRANWRTHRWLAHLKPTHPNDDWKTLDKAIVNADTVFKNDRTTTVVKARCGDITTVIKRYNARSFGHAIKRTFRLSRARRCWSMSYKFQACGLNVCRPLLMYEKRLGPLRQDAYFVNEFIEGEILLTLLPKMDSHGKKRVAEAVFDAFKIMQQYRLTHGDLKASNLLWLDGHLVFIDLDAAKKHRFLFSWRWSHRKDRRRFLKNWINDPELEELFKNS
jgi:tRNA A-37 threonylcarbamoyl transferase component Bud32